MCIFLYRVSQSVSQSVGEEVEDAIKRVVQPISRHHRRKLCDSIPLLPQVGVPNNSLPHSLTHSFISLLWLDVILTGPR
jgi:hypothetical protein